MSSEQFLLPHDKSKLAEQFYFRFTNLFFKRLTVRLEKLCQPRKVTLSIWWKSQKVSLKFYLCSIPKILLMQYPSCRNIFCLLNNAWLLQSMDMPNLASNLCRTYNGHDSCSTHARYVSNLACSSQLEMFFSDCG